MSERILHLDLVELGEMTKLTGCLRHNLHAENHIHLKMRFISFTLAYIHRTSTVVKVPASLPPSAPLQFLPTSVLALGKVRSTFCLCKLYAFSTLLYERNHTICTRSCLASL